MVRKKKGYWYKHVCIHIDFNRNKQVTENCVYECLFTYKLCVCAYFNNSKSLQVDANQKMVDVWGADWGKGVLVNGKEGFAHSHLHAWIQAECCTLVLYYFINRIQKEKH